jgi:hypothetical protein
VADGGELPLVGNRDFFQKFASLIGTIAMWLYRSAVRREEQTAI